MSRLISILEKLVTRRDYFHQGHIAENFFIDPVCSYYFDLRARAAYPGELLEDLPVIVYGSQKCINPVHAAQLGLGLLQLFWDSGDQVYLARADKVARSVTKTAQLTEQGLVWMYPIPKLRQKNWKSALAQGQVASFLFRVGLLNREAAYIHSAVQMLEPFWWDINRGGVRAALEGHVWFEEFCIDPPPYTLNGFIIGFLALRDAYIVTGESKYDELFRNAVETVASAGRLFDIGGWSKYDLTFVQLGKSTVYNVASPYYHRFHIELLKILGALTKDQRFGELCSSWKEGLVSNNLFFHALLQKMFYRMRVQNNHASIQ